MATDTTPIKELDLIREVGEWSLKNFGDLRKPEYGIVEEVGEAVHCVLKHFQKIRGMDDEAVFVPAFTDALADAVIYLADWCDRHNTYFQFAQLAEIPAEGANENRVIAHLLQTCSVIFGTAVDEQPDNAVNRIAAQKILNALNYWGLMYGIQLAWAVTLTWNKVKQRNWKQNPLAPKPEHA